jgi:hypothetical protein
MYLDCVGHCETKTIVKMGANCGQFFRRKIGCKNGDFGSICSWLGRKMIITLVFKKNAIFSQILIIT